MRDSAIRPTPRVRPAVACASSLACRIVLSSPDMDHGRLRAELRIVVLLHFGIFARSSLSSTVSGIEAVVRPEVLEVGRLITWSPTAVQVNWIRSRSRRPVMTASRTACWSSGRTVGESVEVLARPSRLLSLIIYSCQRCSSRAQLL